MSFKEDLQNLINLFDKWLIEPEDNSQLEQWVDNASELAYSFEFLDTEQKYVYKIIEMYEEQFKQQLIWKNNNKSEICVNDITEKLDNIINRKQIEQRTQEWYEQMSNIISASELGNLFASPRTRAKMVVSKTLPYVSRNQQLAVPSYAMSAFDWGIRFEPVVKQIYEYKYGTVVKELGRLVHPTYSKCSASPDGLVISCPKNERIGRLVEIKCPVTREINGSIPKDYYAQMQMQLQVTGLDCCDYIEAVFSSTYNNMSKKNGPGLYNGYIALIRYEELKDGQEFYYNYSPVNTDSTWIPSIADGEEIIEIIPWMLQEWSEQIVVRNDDWWKSTKILIDEFWEDVEKAKRGEFTIPESTRISKPKKEEKCMIVITKLE